jgi:hypothetical protein
MEHRNRNHPDFWGRPGRGGEEWDAADRTPERGDELGGQGFERPQPGSADEPKPSPGDDRARPDPDPLT